MKIEYADFAYEKPAETLKYERLLKCFYMIEIKNKLIDPKYISITTGRELIDKAVDEAYKELGFGIGKYQQHSDTFAPWISEKFYKQIIKILSEPKSDAWNMQIFQVNNVLMHLNKLETAKDGKQYCIDFSFFDALVSQYGINLYNYAQDYSAPKEQNFVNFLLCEFLEVFERNYKNLYAIAYIDIAKGLDDNTDIIIFKENAIYNVLNSIGVNSVELISTKPNMVYDIPFDEMEKECAEEIETDTLCACIPGNKILYLKERTKNCLMNELSGSVNEIFYKRFNELLLRT